MRLAGQALGTIVLVGVLAQATAVPADVLKTRDGRTRDGAFRGATEEVLKFETPDGDLHLIPISKVESLRFGETPAAAGASYGSAAATPESAPVPRRVVVPAGTRLHVRITDTIDPRRSTEGDRFAALLESPIAVGDLTLVPARAKVYGVVAAAKTAGPVVNRLQLELTDLQIRGRRVSIVTGIQRPVAEEDRGADAPADAAPASAREARVPSGTLLEFRLLQPLEMQLVR